MRNSRTEAVYKEALWPWSANASAVFEIKTVLCPKKCDWIEACL